jgi:hypothetical protein
LHLNQLEAVQRDVASLLEHGLPAETPLAEGAAEVTVAAANPAVPEVAAS